MKTPRSLPLHKKASKPPARSPGKQDPDRPEFGAYIEISLDNLLHNLAQIRARLMPGSPVMAVVKDNAYGCGAGPIAAILEKNGVQFFAVATVSEARFLRDQKTCSPILIFGKATVEELRWGAKNSIHFALDDLGTLRAWADAGIQVRFHCEIDTGMARLGIAPSEFPHFIDLLKKSEKLQCVGVFTHFACADSPEPDSVSRQLRLFNDCLKALQSSGFKPPFIHCANSAAVLQFPGRFNLARPGIALYGCKPDPALDFATSLKPIASLKSHVVKLKRVPAGTQVSYGWNYTCKTETNIATIAAGYAQGVPRFLSSRGDVLINNKRYRIAGNVTMDFIMVDAGPEPGFTVGAEAVIMGSQGKETITPDEIALKGNTIGYEILCNLGTSIPRYFYLKNRCVHRLNPSFY